jgi:hypothetical protein
MEQSRSWEANRSSASEVIPSILWNPKVHYCVQKHPQPVSTISHINPVHPAPSHFLKIDFNIILPKTVSIKFLKDGQCMYPRNIVARDHKQCSLQKQ